MKDRSDDGGSEGIEGIVGRAVEFESMNSKVEGTVDGASSCSSRLEVMMEFHTSASKAPSE
jgi:hypothetical protein